MSRRFSYLFDASRIIFIFFFTFGVPEKKKNTYFKQDREISKSHIFLCFLITWYNTKIMIFGVRHIGDETITLLKIHAVSGKTLISEP